MLNRTHFSVLVGLLAMSAIALSGCGGTECGAGTFEEDGECLPEIAAEDACADGTKLVDQQCVIDESGCGTDAMLDEETGTCEPTPDFCADGTTYDQGTDKCVANTEVVCGEDTVASADGICEPAVDQICGDKTTANADGRCVISADACGDGEIIDPNSGDCVATDTYCSDTTAFDTDSGTCVPTADVCDTGTTFDDESGLCLPDACQTGDVLLNGVCVGPAEALADEADTTSAENDDPSLGGTANEVTVEPIGDTAVFTGTIGEPSDIDGDGNLDQDADVFQFTATAGQWFNVAVQSLGLPAPAFKIEGPNGYVRYSGYGMAPARKIVIPRDGDYTLTILPESVLQSDGDIGPAGSADWEYVATLEEIDAPTATTVDLTANDVTGSYGDLSDNLIEITGFSAGDLIDVTVDTSGEDAEGVLQVWGGTTDFRSSRDISEGDAFSLIVPNSGTLLLVFDWKTAVGPQLDFGLSGEANPNFEPLGSIASDDSVDAPAASFADGDVKTYTFSVGAGQVIEIFHNNDEDEEIDLTLLDSNGNELLSDTFVDDIDDSGSDYNYWYTESGGTFVAEVEATNDLTNEVVTITSSTPNDLGSVGVGDNINATVTSSLDENRSEYHLLTTTEDVRFSGTITANGGNGLDGSIYETDNSVIENLTTGDPLTIDPLNAPAGMYLVRVEAADPGVTEYTVDLSFVEPPLLEQEPNDVAANATTIPDFTNTIAGTSETIADTDPDYFTFNIGQPTIVRYELLESSFCGTVSLLDANENLIDYREGTGSGGAVLESGDYFIEINGWCSSTDRANPYELELEAVSNPFDVLDPGSNDTQANATTLPVSFAGTAAGAITSASDSDVYVVSLSSETDIAVQLSDVGLDLPNTHAGITVEVVDSSGNPLGNAGDTITFPSGDSYITVTGYENSGDGNSYLLDLYEVDVCGNGIVETGEDCDAGPSGSVICSTSCTLNPATATASNSPAVAIPDNDPAGVSDTLSVSGCTTIAATTVDVDISHTYQGDLTITVTSPNGTDVILWNNDGGSSDDVIGNFPDDFAPDESLSAFDGETGDGTWTLTVEDGGAGDDGTLNSWGVNLWCQ
ncbi:MAG: proprotein convertase P-domain-containing protein [Myxococcota bacterium]